MKLLAFTDTHGSRKALKEITKKIKKYKPEFLVCCGDFSIFMTGAETFIKRIDALGIQTYLVHGNHEDDEAISELVEETKHITFLHNEIIEHNSLLIMGYGGDGFSLHDPLFEKTAKRFEKLIKKYQKHTKLLLLHQPPHDSGIDLIYGEHAGNKTTKEFIKKHGIEYVFAGHLHENNDLLFEIEKTTYINPGPFGKIITLPDNN